MANVSANTLSPNGKVEEEDLPDVDAQLPDIVIYSHSSLFYWWPVWLTGLFLAALSYGFGRAFATDDGRIEYIHPNSAVGVSFVAVLLLVIIFTNVRLRGIYSVTAIFAAAFLTVFLAWMGILDDVLSAIPELSIFMSSGFYLTFSLLLLVIWAASFFFFDRLTYYRIRPGQMTAEHMVGGGEESYDVRGMLFEKHGEDYFRHMILGLGSGDLSLKTSGANKKTIEIPNVLFVDSKVRKIQRLIAVKPDDLLGQVD